MNTIDIIASKYLKNDLIIMVIASLLLLFVSIFTINEINPDAVLYLYLARLVSEGASYSEISQVYSWPFFSYLISYVSHFLNLPLLYSAKLINFCFFLLLCYFLMKFIDELKIKRIYFIFIVLGFFAAGLLNYFTFVILDPGFWAFIFASFYEFYKCTRNNLNKYKIFKIFIFVSLALVFRIEAIVFFVAYYIYFFGLIKNPKVLFTNLISLIILLIFFISHGFYGRLNDFVSFFSVMVKNSEKQLLITASNNNFLADLLEENNLLILYSGIFILLLKKLFLGKFTLISIYSLYGLVNKNINKQEKTLLFYLFGFFLIVFFACMYNSFAHFVISSRYLFLNYLILFLILVLFMNKEKTKKSFLYWILIFSLMFGSVLGAVKLFKHEDIELKMIDYLKEVQINTEDVYFNSDRLNIYANKIFQLVNKNNRIINKIDFNQVLNESNYKYLVISYKHGFEIDDFKSYKPIHEINGSNSRIILLENFAR